jgi:O-antigen ligase
MTDVGLDAADPLLPVSALTALVAVILILLATIHCWRLAAAHSALFAATSLIALLFWGTIYWLHYGTFVEPAAEIVRLASIISVFWLARRFLTGFPEQRAAWALLAVAAPGAVFILLGALLQVPLLLAKDQRAVGTFSHANAAAAFVVIAAILALCMALETQFRVAAAAMFLLQLAAVMATRSLGAIAGLAVGSIIAIWSTRRLAARQKILSLLAGALVFGLIAVGVGATGRLAELAGTQSFESAATGASVNSLDWRFFNWSLLLAEWRNEWLVGHGLASTQTHIRPALQLPHSVPVQLLVETGIVGLALVTLAVVWIIRRLLDLRRQYPVAGTAALCTFAAVVVHASESNMLGYTAATYLLAAVLGSAWRFDAPDTAGGDGAFVGSGVPNDRGGRLA